MSAFSIGEWVLSKWGPTRIVGIDTEIVPGGDGESRLTVYDLSNRHWAWAEQLRPCPEALIPQPEPDPAEDCTVQDRRTYCDEIGDPSKW
jgi:hypothetical protein